MFLRSSSRAARSLVQSSNARAFNLAKAAATTQYRWNSSESEAKPKESSSSNSSGGGNSTLLIGAALVAAIGGYYFYSQSDSSSGKGKKDSKYTWKGVDYGKVYTRIADLLEDNPDHDDGSYGPVLVRLAWHASGTYDTKSKTGGSSGATMRFEPESKHGANNGLNIARDHLEKIKKEFPSISYGDLWTLAGVAAVQEMGGPIIPWRPGRSDLTAQACPPDGRLPDASQGAKHVRDIFYKMGFNDQEIVALAGAHALGRCHTQNSGYTGPWTFSPTTFTNDFFTLLVNEKWVKKKWNGPEQYEDKTTGSLMMLPTDMSLIWDSKFKPHVEAYAKDNDLFFKDFAKAYSKLLELGVSFEPNAPTFEFKPQI